MADREGRKAELERKKARLLAMRAEKNKKEVSISNASVHVVRFSPSIWDKEKIYKCKFSKELRRKEQAETSQGVINVQSDLDWKRDETSRILEGLGLPEQAPQGNFTSKIWSKNEKLLFRKWRWSRPSCISKIHWYCSIGRFKWR